MAVKYYSPEQKAEALKYIDTHPGTTIMDAATELKIEKNTLYAWTSKAGRKKIAEEVQEYIRAAAASAKSRPPLSTYPKHGPGGPLQTYEPSPMPRPEPAPEAAPSESTRVYTAPEPTASIRVNGNGHTPSPREVELERENRFLKTIVAAYRERFGE